MTADELEKKYKLFITAALNKVPEEKQLRPSPLVAGPLLEHVKYIFDNEQEKPLEDMFSELLGNASNADVKNNVQPSYVYTLQQFTWVEAKLMNLMYECELNLDCLGVSFRRFNKTKDDIITVFSNEAEPLMDFDDGKVSNVFFEKHIEILSDNFQMSDTIFEKGLNVLQQLNLIIVFDVNTYKNSDKYSLEKHDIDHLEKFEPLKKIKAYTLTSYANDLMKLCINPKENKKACFKCKNCKAVFININRDGCCPVCKSKDTELIL